MGKLFANPLFYGVIACLCYGIGGPFMKKASLTGANLNALLLWYGSGAFAMAGYNLFARGEQVVAGTGVAIFAGAVMGALLGIAFDAILRGFGMMLEGGLLTAVMAIVGTYPIVTAAIEIGFMQIPKGVNLKLIVPGTLLAVAGGIMVSVGMSGR